MATLAIARTLSTGVRRPDGGLVADLDAANLLILAPGLDLRRVRSDASPRRDGTLQHGEEVRENVVNTKDKGASGGRLIPLGPPEEEGGTATGAVPISRARGQPWERG